MTYMSGLRAYLQPQALLCISTVSYSQRTFPWHLAYEQFGPLIFAYRNIHIPMNMHMMKIIFYLLSHQNKNKTKKEGGGNKRMACWPPLAAIHAFRGCTQSALQNEGKVFLLKHGDQFAKYCIVWKSKLTSQLCRVRDILTDIYYGKIGSLGKMFPVTKMRT